MKKVSFLRFIDIFIILISHSIIPKIASFNELKFDRTIIELNDKTRIVSHYTMNTCQFLRYCLCGVVIRL
jgi:hypothetical protein